MTTTTTPRRVRIRGDLYHQEVPEGAVPVTRGRGPWGNPYKVTTTRTAAGLVAEIPVYRRTPEAYRRELERRPRRYVLKPDARAGVDESRFTGWWWDYNEVAGWIQLFVVPGGIVKGYLWRRRVAKTPNSGKSKGMFVLEGSGTHDLERGFTGGDSSAEIYTTLRDALIELAEREFPTCAYLDLEAFDTTGPVVNWPALLGLGPR